MIEPQLSVDSPSRASKAMLRQFAGLWLTSFGGIAAWQAWSDRPGMALALAVAALTVGVSGLAKPEAIRPIFGAMSAVTLPIGKLTSFILLTAFFYLVILPIGLAFKLIGRDTLALRRSKGASSYLAPKRAEVDPANYFRQS